MTDWNLIHYERGDENEETQMLTTGKVYWSVLQNERRGRRESRWNCTSNHHITNERAVSSVILQQKRHRLPSVEVGGTVGDITNEIQSRSLRLHDSSVPA